MHRGWGPWNGWMGWGGHWGRFFAPGELRLALLSLLKDGPKHGYELMKTLEARSGGTYRASAGAVYPTLQQLEDEGLVSSTQQEGKRVYQITETGKQELEKNAATVSQMWERAGGWGWGDWTGFPGPHVAGIAGPGMHVMKSAARAAVRCGNNPDQMARIFEILDRARRDLDSVS
ncbi:MAG TPA: PadR family transcriptional regulator [Spirochaetia bacterium]|nr:PadR family transcriptional regulator [Spirochaetia bacterium]